MNSPSSFSIRPIILILLFFLIIGTVYSPVLYFNYLFHDDANFWVKFKELGFKHVHFDDCISLCRYGDALLINIVHFFIHKVSDLKFLRFLGIVTLSCNAYLLLQQMRRLSFSDIQTFLIISAMFFLPGIADIISSATMSFIVALCIYLSCWSFHRIEIGKGMPVSVFSLLFAVTIYPPGAMFYWVMIGMNILFFRDINNTLFRKNLLRSMAVGIVSLLIYALFVFLMHYSFSHQMFNPLYNPYTMTCDWPGKLQWFFQEPLGNALNLWNIFPKASTSIIILGFILLTALIGLIKKLIPIEPQKRKNIALTCMGQVTLFIFIFFMTFLPNLAAKENAAFYRCLIPLGALIWFVLVWAIFQWMDIIPGILTRWSMIALLSLIAVYAGIKTHQNVLRYRVLPSCVEWNAYKSMAEEIRQKNVAAIHVLLPYHLSIERYDEFGVLSSHYLFDIYHLIYCAFNETGGSRLPLPLLYVSYPGAHVLIELEEIYITKLPNGKWVGRDINRDRKYHDIDHSLLGDSLDQQLILIQTPQPISSKRQNWYLLNLNDTFSPSNYSRLMRGT